ncbi:hypothetical protein GWN65_00805 [Candidatus Bathyarchaeota archaeon]|nr:hypothetical protein [Candidatus Bathyarchaeota archaeon]
MSNSSYAIQIPSDLGTRLRTLFCINRKPENLGEFGDLLQEHIKKCLSEPSWKAYFQEIYEGKKIFGHVDYETRHKVQLSSGRQVYVACALDALVEGFFQPIEIESKCFHCGEPIQVRMAQGNVSSVKPSSSVMWLGASREGDGSCETYLCPYINFFSSAEHVEEWKDKNPTELGMMITLQQSLELARKGYWKTMHLLKGET